MLRLNILEKIAEKINIVEKKNSPTIENRAGINHSTVGSVQQAGNINNIKNFAGSEEYISDIEIKILKVLYLELKKTSKYPRLDIVELHKKLGISDGSYMGTVNDSKFIKVEGNDYVITETGIRFMDSFIRNNKPEVDIVSLAHSGGPNGQELSCIRLANHGSVAAIGIECSICADDIEEINFANIERINPNEESRNLFSFKYSDTILFSRLFKNLRIIFKYKNKDGFKFSSGRYLNQVKRADGNYNISVPAGDYFEV